MKEQINYSDLALLSHDVVENVQKLVAHGAASVELLMDGPYWNQMEDQFSTLVPALREEPVTYSVHPPAWDINLTSENRATRETAFSEYKKAIQFASLIEASHVVIHPGFCFSPAFHKKTAQRRAAQLIQQLCEIAKERDVKLAIENVGYSGSSLFTQEEYVEFLHPLDDTAMFLIDTGHAHLNDWDIPLLIEQTKDRLFALHLHDNHQTGDDHLPIGEGTIDWEAVFKAVQENKVECQLILEYAPGTPLEKLEDGKKRLQQELLIG